MIWWEIGIAGACLLIVAAGLVLSRRGGTPASGLFLLDRWARAADPAHDRDFVPVVSAGSTVGGTGPPAGDVAPARDPEPQPTGSASRDAPAQVRPGSRRPALPAVRTLGHEGPVRSAARAKRPAPRVSNGSDALREDADDRVRILPGRLRVLAGPEAGREIRFVVPEAVTDVALTIGRSASDTGRHIHLRGRTVSRLHARLVFLRGEWMASNLSLTNALEVNGRAMKLGSAPRLLRNGDRLRLGEVVLRYERRTS